MADGDENEDYDYEDFEDYDHDSPSNKRKGTPHSSKKSPQKAMNWEDDEEYENAGAGEEENVEGQDLESYMKQFSSSENLENANLEDLACELKPLDGVRPKLENAEEEQLLHKLGYDRSYSNNSSPVKGRSIKVSTNSPSPSRGPSFLSIEEEFVLNYQESMKIAAAAASEENPSTNTSKDNKVSPVPVNASRSFHAGQKVGFSFERNSATQEHDSDGADGAGDKLLTRKSASENYMSSFKSLIETSSPKQKSDNKLASPKSSPNAADLLLMANKKPTVESERENAERVDALLMELFPERFEKQQQQQQKKGKGKGTKKAAAAALAAASGGAAAGLGIGAFNKNQVYGLAAQRPLLGSLEGLHSGGGGGNSYAALQDDDGSAPMPLMASLDQQLKLLKRELKAKDDKITRLTEHAVMMGTHMDRLKGEAAHLTVQLREANMELEAKEGRLQEALKARKKLKKAAAAGGGGGGGGGSADLALVENENQRLREREQALMDAIEELSSQNEDLIQKLKESMERELVLSSKRAAQISHNVSALSDQQHSQSQYHLPQIGGGGGGGGAYAQAPQGGLRTQSEPTAEVPKRRKKKSL